MYCSPGSGSALNNLKNRCQNFIKIFFSNFFYTMKKRIFGNILKSGEYLQGIFQNN
jgi:hypothetical protein